MAISKAKIIFFLQLASTWHGPEIIMITIVLEKESTNYHKHATGISIELYALTHLTLNTTV